jgi:hypothetical protein
LNQILKYENLRKENENINKELKDTQKIQMGILE